MDSKSWSLHRSAVLSKSDKSFKQSVDAPVVQVVEIINKTERFLTTSSCSGRIMLIRETSKSKRKNAAEFVFVSHELVDPDICPDLIGLCLEKSSNVFFKLEPLIIHIECETLDLAVALLHRMKEESHLKHTSIVSAARGKFVVAVKAMSKMEIPIVYDGEHLVTEDQLRRFISIANERMAENFVAITELQRLLESGILDTLGKAESGSPRDLRKLAPKLVPLTEVSLERYTLIPPRDVLCMGGQEIQFTSTGPMKTCTIAGEKVGMIPDGPHYPINNGTQIDCFEALPDMSFIHLDKELWALIYSKKRSGKPQLNWKRISTQIEFECCFYKDTEIVLKSKNETFELLWDEAVTRRTVSVDSFYRVGDAVIIPNHLSPDDAQIYADNMHANLIVSCPHDGAPNVLFSRTGSTIVTHRENGVNFVVDFSRDTFSKKLVSERARFTSVVNPGEFIAETAQGVDCVGITIAAKRPDCTVAIIVSDAKKRELVMESVKLNNVKDVQVLDSMEALPWTPHRLIITDPNFRKKDLSVQPGGSIHALCGHKSSLE